MIQHMNYYALATNKNNESLRQGAFPIHESEMKDYNENGYDIFWTMNGFDFGKRKKTDLKWINCFYADLDCGSQKEMQERIKNHLLPSSIVQTKKGFHLYWFLDEPINCEDAPEQRADWFSSWTKARIVPALLSDQQAADACRLLRVPMMRYWKDGKGDFYCDIVGGSNRFYSLNILEKFFPEKKQREVFVAQAQIKTSDASGFWEKANILPVKDCLEKLSGSTFVHGEVFSFKQQKNITRIICNGRQSNAWIDQNGFIGSTDGAGPAIPNWLYWYQRDWKKVAEILKKEFNL